MPGNWTAMELAVAVVVGEAQQLDSWPEEAALEAVVEVAGAAAAARD